MGQLIKVLFGIDNAHTVPQRSLVCRPGKCGLNQVDGPKRPSIISSSQMLDEAMVTRLQAVHV